MCRTLCTVVIGIIAIIALATSIFLPFVLIKSSGRIDLAVYSVDNQTIADLPKKETYVYPDELWDVPKIQHKNIDFDSGVITISKPGNYSLNSITSFSLENKTPEQIRGNAFSRIAQGAILEENKHLIAHDVLSVVSMPLLLEPYHGPITEKYLARVTLQNQIEFEITKDDIEKKINNVVSQYMFSVFLHENEEYPEDFIISRDTYGVKTLLILNKK